jgi:hypothetical protein
MVVVKKLIALALLAAFLISTGIGCSGGPTNTGGSKTGSGTSTQKP